MIDDMIGEPPSALPAKSSRAEIAASTPSIQQQPQPTTVADKQLSSRTYMQAAPRPVEPSLIDYYMEKYKSWRRTGDTSPWAPPIWDITTVDGIGKALFMFGVAGTGGAVLAERAAAETISVVATKVGETVAPYVAPAAQAFLRKAAQVVTAGGIMNSRSNSFKVETTSFNKIETLGSSNKQLFATNGLVSGRFHSGLGSYSIDGGEYGVFVDAEGVPYVLNRFTGDYLGLQYSGFTKSLIKTPNGEPLKTFEGKEVKLKPGRDIVVIGDRASEKTLAPYTGPIPSPAPTPISAPAQSTIRPRQTGVTSAPQTDGPVPSRSPSPQPPRPQ